MHIVNNSSKCKIEQNGTEFSPGPACQLSLSSKGPAVSPTVRSLLKGALEWDIARHGSAWDSSVQVPGSDWSCFAGQPGIYQQHSMDFDFFSSGTENRAPGFTYARQAVYHGATLPALMDY